MQSSDSLSREDLLSWAKEDVGFVGIEMRRVSSILLVQLLRIQRARRISMYSITDEIQALEGRWPTKGTKPQEPFRGAVLKGLWRKHFTDPRFMAQNLAAHFEIDKGGNSRLERIVAQAFAENTSGFVDDSFANTISHLGTVAALEERACAQKLTGEWIVFHRHLDESYYLTLASHLEDDEDIRARVSVACSFDKFPFSY